MKNTITSFLILHCALLISQASLAQIIHVPADYPTIQQGIDAADPGDTILVANGVYYEQISLLGKKPLMVSSYYLMDDDTSHISATIIDGSLLTDLDLASVVYFTNGEDTTSTLCGFTIRGGKGTFVPAENERSGGGIYVSGSGAKIIHNKITGNILDDTQPVNGQNCYGGGIGTSSEYGDHWLCIENNQIIGNAVISQYERACGGGIHTSYHCRLSNNLIAENACSSSATTCQALGAGLCHSGGPEAVNIFLIWNNKFLNNLAEAPAHASGAGIFLLASQLSFNQNEVTGNQSICQGTGPAVGGLSYVDPSTVNKVSNNITHNVFRQNIGRNGGGALFLLNWAGIPDPEVVIISNNYFIENEGVNGGAIVSMKIPFRLQNNVLKGNYASLRGGALFIERTGTSDYLHLATIINNSFWNNTCDGKGGAIFSNKARPLIFNTIFYEDTATEEGAEIYLNFTTDTLDLAYSSIDQSLIFGNLVDWGGNISANPEFQDDTCHISDLSTSEDAGAITVTIRGMVYPSPNDDFEGNFRPYHMGVDIGADECDIITGLPDHLLTKAEVYCYPNPTAGSSQFTVHSSQEGYVTLKVYDIQGREIAILVDGNLPAGEHTLCFDMSGMPAGIYFYRLAVGDQRSAVGGKIVKL